MKCLLLLMCVVAAGGALYDNANKVCKDLLAEHSPAAEANDDCVADNSKDTCDNCMYSKNCAGDKFCCPYLKKCVNSTDRCYFPIANCNPVCYDSNDPTSCSCSESDFPNKWVKCTNDPSTYAYYGEKKSSVQVSYSRNENSVGALKETDDMAEGALCNHNILRAAAGLSPVQWNECLAKFAKDYAEELQAKNCELEHSDGSRRVKLCGFNYVGENLYNFSISSGIDDKTKKDAGWIATQAWWDELADYVYAMNTDGSPGGFDECGTRNEHGPIGHLTQVMWSTTTHIGCDQALCGNNAHVVVCVYGEGGNYENTPAFSLEARNLLNASPEAAPHGGLPTCTDGGPSNNDGIYTTTPQPTTTTTTTSGESTTGDIPPGGDGKCMLKGGQECKFPVKTPWGDQTDCNFFNQFGYSTKYCYQFVYNGLVYVDECDLSDPDCA